MAVLQSRRIFIAAAVLALAAFVAVTAGVFSHRPAPMFGANWATEGSIAVTPDNFITEGSIGVTADNQITEGSLPHVQGG
jgi:hypothetical protein